MAVASVETLIPVNAKADYILNVVYEAYAEGQALTVDEICTDINWNLKEKGKSHQCDKEEVEMVVEFLTYARKLKKATKRQPIIVPGNGKLDYYTVNAYIKL